MVSIAFVVGVAGVGADDDAVVDDGDSIVVVGMVVGELVGLDIVDFVLIYWECFLMYLQCSLLALP